MFVAYKYQTGSVGKQIFSFSKAVHVNSKNRIPLFREFKGISNDVPSLLHYSNFRGSLPQCSRSCNIEKRKTCRLPPK